MKGDNNMKDIYDQFLNLNYNNNQLNYDCKAKPNPCLSNSNMYDIDCFQKCIDLSDHGPNPYVVNINEATKQNYTFRTALWTGDYLQLTVMSINPGDCVGLEIHHDVDQFIRIEEGQGLALIGDCKDNLYFREKVYDDYVILIPAGKWHNLINTGCIPLKLYSIYAPPEHPHGTIHKTKEDAEEHDNH